MDIVDLIKECSVNTLNQLCEMQNERDELKPNFVKLIFPKDKQPKKSKQNLLRFSEQEARLLFIQAIEKLNKELYYSIETPTIEKYSFSKKKKETSENDNPSKKEEAKSRSGSLDMCLFQKNKKMEKLKGF